VQRTAFKPEQVGMLPLPRVGGALSDALGKYRLDGRACQTAAGAGAQMFEWWLRPEARPNRLLSASLSKNRNAFRREH